MSNFQGPAGKGAMRDLRKIKQLEAEERNAATPPARRSIKRGLARAMKPQGGGPS